MTGLHLGCLFDTEEVVFSDSTVTDATPFVSTLSVDAPREWVGWDSGTSATKGSTLWSSKECLWRINESSKCKKQTYHKTWGDLHSCWCFAPLSLCTRSRMNHWMCVLYLSSQSAKLFLAVSIAVTDACTATYNVRQTALGRKAATQLDTTEEPLYFLHGGVRELDHFILKLEKFHLHSRPVGTALKLPCSQSVRWDKSRAVRLFLLCYFICTYTYWTWVWVCTAAAIVSKCTHWGMNKGNVIFISSHLILSNQNCVKKRLIFHIYTPFIQTPIFLFSLLFVSVTQ